MTTSHSEIETLADLEVAARRHDYWYTYASGPAYYAGRKSSDQIREAVDRLGEPAQKFWQEFCNWREGGSKGDPPTTV